MRQRTVAETMLTHGREAPSPARPQSIGCELCGHRLEISVGQRGNLSGILVERCVNRSCANARPHQHTPTHEEPSREIGPTPGKKRTYSRRGPYQESFRLKKTP